MQTTIPGQLRQLTGLRAIAAGWVTLFHFRVVLVANLPAIGPLLPIIDVGYLAVDVFFILSGFVITYAHVDRLGERWTARRAGRFLWLRFTRMWPVMFVMLLVTGSLHAVQLISNGTDLAAVDLDPLRFLAHVALVQAWGTTEPDWNRIDWPLSALWLAYLAFAAMAWLLCRVRRRMSSRALVIGAIAAVLPIVLIGVGLRDGSHLMFNGRGMVGGLAPLRVIGEFVGGSLVAMLVLRRSTTRPARPWWPTVIALLIAGTLVAVDRYDPVHRTLYRPDFATEGYPAIQGHVATPPAEAAIVIPLFLVLVWGLAVCRTDPLVRLLSTAPVVRLGELAFGLCLCHYVVLVGYRVLEPRLHPQARPVALLTALILAVLGGYALYRLVERPAQNALRNLYPDPAEPPTVPVRPHRQPPLWVRQY